MSKLIGKKLLVTGAGGFIGRALIDSLIHHGAKIRALLGPDDQPGGWSQDRVSTSQADIGDRDTIGPMLSGSEIVVHLAGPASVRDSYKAASRYARVHVGGTATLLDLACSARVRRFVYISSAEVYGRPLHNPVEENHRLEARSPYAAAKIGGEQFVESATHSSDIQVVILRPFSVYGPGHPAGSLLSTILQQALRDSQIQLNDLRPIRDYCFITDVTAAIVQACSVQLSKTCIANVGTGIGTSVFDLANLVTQILGRHKNIVGSDNGDRPEDGKIFQLIANRRQAQEQLEWQPVVSLTQGLKQTIDAWGK